MRFNIDDKLIVGDILGTVAYTNNGFAWVVPSETAVESNLTFQGKKLILGVVFAKLDENGRMTLTPSIQARHVN
jgi:hypothetical protein